MRSIFSLILICILVLPLSAQQNVPIVPKFAVPGARWYFQNTGKNNDVVKNIYAERTGDSVVQAFNFDTKKFQDFSAATIIFHYLDADSQVVEYDTLLVRSDTFGVFYYDARNKVFDYLYNNLLPGDYKLESVNPFAKNNARYQNRQFLYQQLTKATCATINNITIGYYAIGKAECSFYPLGTEIIERIGPTYYMLRYDSCEKDLYGGPLLWYSDPELGLYVQGKTDVTLCKDDSTMANSMQENYMAATKLNVYPVPFTNILHLEATGKETSFVHIYAMDGKCFYTIKLRATENLSLHTENWPRGIYIVKRQDESGISSQKVIKQ